MATKKPSFTKIVIDNENGIHDLEELLAVNDTDSVKVTPQLVSSISDTYKFMTVDFSECLIIESRNGHLFVSTITGDEPDNAKDIVTKMQADAIRELLEQGDADVIEKMYYSINRLPAIDKVHKAEIGSDADKPNATEEKARKLYTEEHKKVVAANLIEMINAGKVAPTNTAEDKISEENKQAGAFCVSKGIKAKGANPATCNKIAAMAYHDLTGGDLPKFKSWSKWDALAVKKYHAELTTALKEKGYL